MNYGVLNLLLFGRAAEESSENFHKQKFNKVKNCNKNQNIHKSKNNEVKNATMLSTVQRVENKIRNNTAN